MREFTNNRLERIRYVASMRQPDLRVVLENLHNPHNINAVLRTAEAVGVQFVHIIASKPFSVHPKISQGAHKWLTLIFHKTLADCYAMLEREGFSIYATALCDDAVHFRNVDYTAKTAIVFGNEHDGLSGEAIRCAHKVIKVPIYGMVQSLNVSVSCAVVLYEAERQRSACGMYPSKVPKFGKELEAQWLNR